MCIVSMVYDHYRPQFDRWPAYSPAPFVPAPPAPEIDHEKLARLIADFQAAKKAAETVDRLTGQPDCVDPEKAKLEARVAELERKLVELTAERK